MKKILLALVVFLIPIVVKANIMCNDGTTSPSCADCHRGCCSHHGGCSSNSTPNYSNETRSNSTYTQPVENYGNIHSQQYSTDSNKIEEDNSIVETEDNNSVVEAKNDDSNDELDSDYSSYYDDDEDEENDEDSDFATGILGTGALAGIAYAVYKAKNK